MDLKKTFATNKEKEESGVWVDGIDGARFLIARQGNRNHTELAAKLMKPHRVLINMGKADDKAITEVAAEITARTILLDWEGVKAGGQEIKYSHEVAKRMLLEYGDFADYITALSKSMTLYQDDEKAAEVKN